MDLVVLNDINFLVHLADKLSFILISPAEPDGGGAPDFCHSVASAASFLMYDSSTVIKIFSGFMSVWMILHFVCR